MSRSDPAPWVLATGLLALAVIQACEDVSVVSVQVMSVNVSPSAGTIFTGDTLQFVATPRAASGTPLQDRPVTWSIDDSAVAAVTSAGLVQATGAGETRIRARAGEMEGSAAVTVRERPVLMFSESEVRFEAMAGQGPSPPRTIHVIASGDAALSGLSVQTAHPPGSPGGWLDVTLQGSETPISLVLRGLAGGLPPGTYHAQVVVAAPAAGNSPWTLPVEFRVSPPAPAIRLAFSAIGFVWEDGQALPPASSVSITNAGAGSLTGLATSVRYGQGEPASWLSAQLSSTSAPSTLILGVSPGPLSTGVYGAVVEVGSPVAGNSPQELQVRLTVGEPPPEIELVPGSATWTVTEGQDLPEHRAINVLNGGGGELTRISASPSYGQGQASGWLTFSLDGSSAPTTLRLSLNRTDLLPGSYDATVSVVSDEAVNSPRSALVQLEVLPRVAPELSQISANPEVIAADGVSTARITVRLRDSRGDPISFGGADVALRTTGGTLSTVVDREDGTYTALLRAPTFAGIGLVSGTVDGQEVGGSATIQFVLDSEEDPVSASRSSVAAEPSTGILANGSDASTVRIQLRSTSNNPVGGLDNDDFSIALSGNAVRTAVSETSTEGTYTFQVTNSTAETVTVTVIADGITLEGTPTIQFVLDSEEDPVSASRSTVDARPDSAIVADGTAASTVSLRIRDPNGNFVNGLQDDDFVISLGGSAKAGPVRSRPPPGGYVFDVTNTLAETVTIVVTVLGVTLDDQPSVAFKAGPISAEESSAVADPSTGVTANDADASTVTVRLSDRNGNPIGGLDDDDFSIDVSGDGEEGPVRETDTSGTYTFRVTNETAETVTVTVEADDVVLADRPVIRFAAGPVSGEDSSASADPSSGLVPNGTDASTVTVELEDENGNPVGGLVDGEFSIQLTGDAVRTAVVQTNTVGTYAFGVTNTTAEEVTVTITVHGSTVEDRPEIDFDGEN